MSFRVVRNVLLAAALAAGGLWLAGKVLAGRKGSGVPALAVANQARDSGSSIQMLNRDVAALRSELALLAQSPRSEPSRPASDPGSASASPAAPADKRPTTEERRQIALQEHLTAVAVLDTRMALEAQDLRWTSAMREEVAKIIPAGSGSAVRSVECHASLCRVEMTHPDRAALDRFLESSGEGLRYSFQLFYERSGSALNTTIFLAREGQPTPDPASSS